ncbi:8155_t:CDS:2 [Ambispora gerdemannii]|uniref:8155_t:CDS:1 n=1 Tax=Ambispora gerdemannii TaxID=144530 RepID=A0A9N9FRJ3_9GLOM|nr:8155_t:CDS:2 [Ambispora gerdemannii]
MTDVAKLLSKLSNPVPPYVLGCLPAIATIGAAPKDAFIDKLLWVVQCLACPFLGLFYTCNVRSNETAIYWLPSRCFIGVDGSEIHHRPFGHRAMMVIKPGAYSEKPGANSSLLTDISNTNASALRKVEECIANASVLERLSSLASAYYIMLGAIIAISKVVRPHTCDDWPYLPLALAWTLPAIYRRTVHGRLIVRDPKKSLGDDKIIVKKFDDDDDKEHMHIRVVLTALASIAVPWISVLLAYFTPPKGFFCRSRYLTTFCTIWSFNSIVAYIHHWVEERNKIFDRIVRIWFSISGIGVAILLLVLAVLSNDASWWKTIPSFRDHRII